jgi:hypothetical protein
LAQTALAVGLGGDGIAVTAVAPDDTAEVVLARLRLR